VDRLGQVLFYVASGVLAAAGAAYVLGLLWTLVSTRSRGEWQPKWVHYAGFIFRLAIPTMVLGLVLWGRLAWWFLLLFAPFAVGQYFAFQEDRSLSRRERHEPSDD
jgi:peptidoglycan biosynthesis protein MviN/MurJ (putative lipid II flippase)